jgi:hypothetical protein
MDGSSGSTRIGRKVVILILSFSFFLFFCLLSTSEYCYGGSIPQDLRIVHAERGGISYLL